MQRFSVQISNPCPERWDNMQPTKRGRFCASCQKAVVDYTHLSDQELVKLLSQPLESNCGRFRDEQLNRVLAVPNEGVRYAWRHWLNVMMVSVFGWSTAQAQLNSKSLPKEPTSQSPGRPEFSVATLPVHHSAVDPDAKWVIHGRVVRQDSSGELVPLEGARVYVFQSALSQSGKFWETRTDQSGNYTLSIPMGMNNTQLSVSADIPKFLPSRVLVEAVPFTSSISLNDIVMRAMGTPMQITSGGLTLVKQPSRWEKLKRTFRLHR